MDSHESNGHNLDANGARKVSVLLADDDQTFLQVVVALLQAQSRGLLDIVATAHSSEECIMRAQALAPEVVVMDMNLPGLGGLWTIPLLHILFPETRVIALTGEGGAAFRSAVLAAGGTDLVSKTAWKTDLIPAIQSALKAYDSDQSIASD